MSGSFIIIDMHKTPSPDSQEWEGKVKGIKEPAQLMRKGITVLTQVSLTPPGPVPPPPPAIKPLNQINLF